MTAQIAALSVARLIARCVGRKEEEAEKAKHEVRIIWGDYFKQPQFDAFPEIHEITHQIMLTASACKQGTARFSGEKLVEQVNRFAEIYWHSKDFKTANYPSPDPPNLPTVYPDWDNMLWPFTLRRIRGQSMSKVLDEGDFVLGRRLGLKSPIDVGDVIEISHPRLGNIVKRLLDCDEAHIWVKGDAFNSIAPSEIGPISREMVVAKALWRISPRGIQRI